MEKQNKKHSNIGPSPEAVRESKRLQIRFIEAIDDLQEAIWNLRD